MVNYKICIIRHFILVSFNNKCLFQEPEVKYDLTLLHSAEDQTVVQLIKKNAGKKIAINTMLRDDSSETWQSDLYNTMLASARQELINLLKYYMYCVYTI